VFNYYGAIYETDLLENAAGESIAIIPPVKFQVLRGEYTLFTRSHGRAILPLRGIVGEEREIPALPPILTNPAKTYIVVSVRTSQPFAVAEQEGIAHVNRAVALASLLLDPFVFGRLLYEGWLGDHPDQFRLAEVLFTPYQQFEARLVEKQIAKARSSLAQDTDRNNRFTLIARLFNRAVTSEKHDEAFLWLWTCLEVFPMADTSNIKPIAPYLAELVEVEANLVRERLGIGRLFGLRCSLVHDGALALNEGELHETVSKLLQIVRAVMRGMCGLPYDGGLKRWLEKTAA
jgi:hypothetical protein